MGRLVACSLGHVSGDCFCPDIGTTFSTPSLLEHYRWFSTSCGRTFGRIVGHSSTKTRIGRRCIDQGTSPTLEAYRNNMRRYLLSLVTLLPIYACTPQTAGDEETEANSGGSGGSSSNVGGSGGSPMGMGGSQVNSSGGSAGESGENSTNGSTDSGGAAGESSTEGSGGSETSSGGAAGNTGGSSNGGSDAGGSGGNNTNGSGGGFEVFGELDPIIGPAEDDPGYIEVIPTKSFERLGVYSKVLVDEDGNFFFSGYVETVDSGILVKLDSDFNVVWELMPSDLATDDYSAIGVVEVDLNEEGEILFAGSPSAGGSSNTDAFVGKLDLEGNLIWHDVWGSNMPDGTIQVTYAPNGNFLTVSYSSSGQAPGNPPDNAGNPVLTWYTPDNERQLLHQVSDSSLSEVLFQNDGSTLAFVRNAYDDEISLKQYGPERAEAVIRLPATFDLNFRAPNNLAFNHTQDVIYTLGGIPSLGSEASLSAYGMAAYALDGTLLWYRRVSDRTKVIDEVEGTTWTGNHLNDGQFKITNDSIIVSGIYQNRYVYGSNPPPDFNAPFIARYDLTGELVWFKQYQTTPSSSRFSEFVLDSNGDIVVFGSGPELSGCIFRVDVEDGSVIP